MKWIKRILISLLVLVIAAVVGGYFWLRSSAPLYNGELSLKGLHGNVEAYFDDFGVPHIYAQDKHDMYLAFGYLHAQDRLFQMEMLRRAGNGRLAEIIGQPLVKVDKMFLSLGVREYAVESAARFNTQKGSPIYDDVMAYLDGINYYIENGDTPPEFSIIGIPKEKFTVEDLYYITGAMSFSFSQAQKTEPVIDYINKNYGNQYLEDMGLMHEQGESYIRTNKQGDQVQPDAAPISQPEIMNGNASENSDDPAMMLAACMSEVEKILPITPLEGSNSWVIGGNKTESGEVIFCNDTHIGYLAPQTWYEAHLNSPDFEMYGHFMSGIPFALVGRNRSLSWGLTMLLNDDMDFYYEREDPSDKNKFLRDGNYVPCEMRQYTIKVKDNADTTLTVRVGAHGPVINDAFEGMSKEQPISMYWTYTKLPNQNIEALYGMNNATNFTQFSSQVSRIHAPGLSVNYGDKMGNIAWWGCASLMERPTYVNSWTILDGTTSINDPIGFYPFEKNPSCINPSWGYIYSANDWPQDLHHQDSQSTLLIADTTDVTPDRLWYPGYYKPQYRADRIRKLLEEDNEWTLEKMKRVMTDHTSDADMLLLQNWYNTLDTCEALDTNKMLQEYMGAFEWNGVYEPISYGPTFFNHMLYHYLHETMADELGESRFQLFLQTHQVQRTQLILNNHADSPWWDNVNTDIKETKTDIILGAFQKTIAELTEEFGGNYKIWNWRKVCDLEIKHPLGEVAIFRPIFNIGPMEVYGGNETILQSGFKLDSTGHYKVFFGSQMRIMVDFANVDSSLNITPSGQSGHVMSKHYSDQAALYRAMEFRVQHMDKQSVMGGDRLLLKP